MLGRKDYTPEELDHAKRAIAAQTAAYTKLAAAVDGTGARDQLEAFEPLFFNNMVLALDRPFVHRIRPVTGKDGNPLNEVELLAESLINNGGVLDIGKVIKLKPEESVLGLEAGEKIELSAADFDRLQAAFFATLEEKFVA